MPDLSSDETEYSHDSLSDIVTKKEGKVELNGILFPLKLDEASFCLFKFIHQVEGYLLIVVSKEINTKV